MIAVSNLLLNTSVVLQLKHDAEDGGIIIDMEMRSSCSHVYAAGDIVSTSHWTDTEQWFQVSIL